MILNSMIPQLKRTDDLTQRFNVYIKKEWREYQALQHATRERVWAGWLGPALEKGANQCKTLPPSLSPQKYTMVMVLKTTESVNDYTISILLSLNINCNQCCFCPIIRPESWLKGSRQSILSRILWSCQATTFPPFSLKKEDGKQKIVQTGETSDFFLKRRQTRISLTGPGNVPTCSNELITAWTLASRRDA